LRKKRKRNLRMIFRRKSKKYIHYNERTCIRTVMVLNYRRDLVGAGSLKFCLVKRKEKKMKFMENVKKFGKDLAKATDKNSPAILTGIAVVGLVTTAVLAWKAAPKAQKIVEEHKERVDRLGGDVSEEEKREETVEVIKEMAPVVAPPIVMGAVTAACII
jgi:hypothetical protein